MQPGDVFSLLIVVVGLAGGIMYLAKRFFSFREKQLEVDARLAAEKAAQYASSNAQLEQRVRVLEQIVTDRGAETAAQIDAACRQSGFFYVIGHGVDARLQQQLQELAREFFARPTAEKMQKRRMLNCG